MYRNEDPKKELDLCIFILVLMKSRVVEEYNGLSMREM